MTIVKIFYIGAYDDDLVIILVRVLLFFVVRYLFFNRATFNYSCFSHNLPLVPLTSMHYICIIQIYLKLSEFSLLKFEV